MSSFFNGSSTGAVNPTGVVGTGIIGPVDPNSAVTLTGATDPNSLIYGGGITPTGAAAATSTPTGAVGMDPQLQAAFNSATGFLSNNSQPLSIPSISVPGLSGGGGGGGSVSSGSLNGLIGQLSALGAAGLNSPEQQSQTGYNAFSGTSLDQNPATQAALQAFQQTQAPDIMQQMAGMGLNQGGAVPQSLAMAQAAYMEPILMQEQQNQLTASQGLGQLGSQLGSRQLGGLSAAGNLGLGQYQTQQQAATAAQQIASNQAISGQQTGAQVAIANAQIAAQQQANQQANQLAAMGLQANIGQDVYGNALAANNQAFNQAQLPTSIQNQINASNYATQQYLSQLIQQANLGPASTYGTPYGSTGTGTGTTTTSGGGGIL